MKVIVTVNLEDELQVHVSVRKCPPHSPMYKAKANEIVCELEDYSTEDIQMYLEKEVTLTEAEARSEMSNYLITGKRGKHE